MSPRGGSRVRVRVRSRRNSVEKGGLFKLEDLDDPTQMQMQVRTYSADKKDSSPLPVDWSRFKTDTNDKLRDMELMRERFAKLLLGEDMSGGKKAVSSALALSNAITNLSASIFGELWRLEPLPPERKARWRREIGWFLSVVDHIVEFVPSYQTSDDGSIIEVMVTKPRSDLQMNIPALGKLEAMLLECMESCDCEYNTSDKDEEEMIVDKWWIPTPRIPDGGLSLEARKMLQHERESVNQILKAVLAINSQVLSEMEIPDLYWESLPKKGKVILGDVIYRHITSDNFCPEIVLCSVELSSDHTILDVKNRIEAAAALWRKKIRSSSKSTSSDQKREIHAERAEILINLLNLKFPGLPQTVLDINKIQYNKDVGQSVVESYSRVLESLAFNILSRIDHVLQADEKANLKASCSTSTISLFQSPSLFPRIYPTPSCTSPTQHGILVMDDDDEEEEKGLYTTDPPTKTLSDFISWQDNCDNIDEGIQRLTPSASDLDPAPLAIKKLSPVSVASNFRRYYWLYIESLEKTGVVYSPPSRD